MRDALLAGHNAVTRRIGSRKSAEANGQKGHLEGRNQGLGLLMPVSSRGTCFHCKLRGHIKKQRSLFDGIIALGPEGRKQYQATSIKPFPAAFGEAALELAIKLEATVAVQVGSNACCTRGVRDKCLKLVPELLSNCRLFQKRVPVIILCGNWKSSQVIIALRLANAAMSHPTRL